MIIFLGIVFSWGVLIVSMQFDQIFNLSVKAVEKKLRENIPNKILLVAEAIRKKINLAKIHKLSKTNLLLENVTVINSRVENLNNKGVFDHIISRAFSSVARFLELTQHLLKQQGSLLAMKGNISKNEISEIPKSWKFIEQHDVHIPMLFKKRTILELKIMEEKFGSNNFNS